MNKAKIEQIAKEFCEAEGADYDQSVFKYMPDGITDEVQLHEWSANFLQSMIDRGDLISAEELTRFRDEYKGEADTSALCCAVADVEKEHDLSTYLLKSNIEVMEELINLQRERIKQFESKALSSAGKEVLSEGTILPFQNFPLLSEYIQHAATFWHTDSQWSGLLQQVNIVCTELLKFKSAPSKEISDQEIEDAYGKNNIPYVSGLTLWNRACKWYRNQVKQNQ